MFTSQAKNYPVLIIIVSCIIGPIQEELINRYFVMKVVLKNINQYVAAFIQAIIFAVFHGTLMQGITAFILGFIIGLMYVISDSLLPCIVMHIVVNMIQCFFGSTKIRIKALGRRIVSISIKTKWVWTYNTVIKDNRTTKIANF